MIKLPFHYHITSVLSHGTRIGNYTIPNDALLNTVILKIRETMDRWKYLPVGGLIELEYNV